MFSLRSSPSTLVCDLREGWASTSTSAAVHLSAPRPHRPSVLFGFDVSYDNGSSSIMAGADGSGRGGSGTGSSARGAFSPAVSDYAGVFEAGFDPAQVRASMTKKAVEVETAPAGREHRMEPARPVIGGACSSRGRGWPDLNSEACTVESFLDDDDDDVEAEDDDDDQEEGDAIGRRCRNDQEEEETDFLFEMEGLTEPPQTPWAHGDRRESDGRGSSGSERSVRVPAGGRRGSGDRGGNSGGWGAAAAAAAAAATAAGVVAATAGAGRQRTAGGLCCEEKAEQGSTAISSSATAGGVREVDSGACAAATAAAAAVAGGALNKTAALRQPRVIAPRRTRCVGGGMYRLRLSTSC